VYLEAQGLTQLQQLTTRQADGAAEAEPVVLLSWPGRTGRLRYLDASGEWRDSWPPEQGPPGAALPRAVALETGLEGVALLVAPTRTSELPLPTRRQMESM
jgi:hypothetical protein